MTWSWQRALVGLVYALPAALVIARDPVSGLAVAIGVVPAAIVAMPARRRDRVRLLVVGLLAGVSLFFGGVLAHLPMIVAAVGLVVVVVLAALLTTRVPSGKVVLVLCAPLVAAGLSYDDYATSFETVLLLAGGAAYAWLVSLAWPEREVASGVRSAARPTTAGMLAYGVRLGVAAASAYVLAHVLGLDHPGWAPAACLLVARPQHDLLHSRGIGRVVSVLVGAAAAVVLLAAGPSDVVYAVAGAAVLVGATATVGSRWYVTSAFTTFYVMLMLLIGHQGDAAAKVGERIGETVLGVAFAYLAVVVGRRSVS